MAGTVAAGAAGPAAPRLAGGAAPPSARPGPAGAAPAPPEPAVHPAASNKAPRSVHRTSHPNPINHSALQIRQAALVGGAAPRVARLPAEGGFGATVVDRRPAAR